MDGQLCMYRLKNSIMQALNRGGYMEVLDQGTIYETMQDAILEIFKQLDKSVCSTCGKRVFPECNSILRQPITETKTLKHQRHH